MNGSLGTKGGELLGVEIFNLGKVNATHLGRGTTGGFFHKPTAAVGIGRKKGDILKIRPGKLGTRQVSTG